MSYIVVNKNGTSLSFEQGKLHNKDGPAVVYKDGTREWWFEGRRHNQRGYAIETKNQQVFIRNGKVNVKIFQNYYEDLYVLDAEKYIPLFHRIIDELNAIDLNCTYIKEKVADFDEHDTVKFYWRGIQHSTDPAEIKKSGTKVYYLYGLKHRDNGPAIVDKLKRSEYWYNHGLLHREDGGPARIIYKFHDKNTMNICWYKYGVIHRLEGPGYLSWNSKVKQYIYKAWYKNGQFHRSIKDGQSEGPALEMLYLDYTSSFVEDTYKVWFENGKCSRWNGPAIEGLINKWYINDVEYEEDEYKKILSRVVSVCYRFKKPIRKRLAQVIYESTCYNKMGKLAICKDVASVISSFL